MTRRASARRKKDRNRSPMTIVAGQEWDRSLSTGDIVCFQHDFPALHIYKVVGVQQRFIYAEDLFNYPLLMERGFKPGDEYASLVLLRLYRPAPYWDIVGPPAQEKTVDAHLVLKLKSQDLNVLFENLAALKEDLDANSVPEG